MTPSRLVVWIALALFCIAGQAQKADRDKPINIEADRLQYDDAKQTTVFTGNVLLTKGTIVIRGDRMVLRQFPDGMQTAVATGKRASFRQKRDGVDQVISGLANEIHYDGRDETVRLVGEGLIKRLECGVTTDEITGGVIVYNIRSEQVNVDGKGPGDSNGRVRITIQPRPDAKSQEAPASTSSGSGGRPADRKGTAQGGTAGNHPDKCPSAAPVSLEPTGRLKPQRGITAASP